MVTPPLLRLGVRSAPRRRLICLPYAGGGVAAYQPWSRTLPADIEVVAAQLPGRESRLSEPALRSITAMVDALLPAVRAATDLPYALFGHSMGAVLAFELARALHADGAPAPVRLFVSARRSPDATDPANAVRALPDANFLDELQRRYGAIPAVVREHAELLELVLPVLRADIEAIETYRAVPGARVACPVHVLGGVDDGYPLPSELGGWQRVATQPIAVTLFDGDHFFVTTEREAVLATVNSSFLVP
jgi:medium-chain acyl-[acyl-carrier-protein] hydrolase